MRVQKPKIVIVVGPTASGKTGLAIELAKHFSGEVISADSRQVYRGLDIGTGKVTADEMEGVPHHLIDIRDVTESYTAADFKRDAASAIDDIVSRGNLPVVAGGTFFYIDALLGRVPIAPVPPNPELRDYLEELPADVLHHRLEELDPKRALTIDRSNKRRLIRALEIIEAIGEVPEPADSDPCPYDPFTVGVDVTPAELHNRIRKRLSARIESGMIEEAEQLIKHGVPHERLEELGLEYRYLSRYLRGELKQDDMFAELETKIKQYAKRQATWLRRDPTIHWFTPNDTEAVVEAVRSFLTE